MINLTITEDIINLNIIEEQNINLDVIEEFINLNIIEDINIKFLIGEAL